MTPDQHDSKTEWRGEITLADRCRFYAGMYDPEGETARVLLLAAEKLESSPQSPAEPGRGDDPARQERMAELKRMISCLERLTAEGEDGSDSSRRQTIKRHRSELSRLRNEQAALIGESYVRELEEERVNEGRLPNGEYPPSPPASPSDLPAREAVDVATWMLEHSYTTGHGDTVADMLGELEAQAKERATTPSRGLVEAAEWHEEQAKRLRDEADKLLPKLEIEGLSKQTDAKIHEESAKHFRTLSAKPTANADEKGGAR